MSDELYEIGLDEFEQLYEDAEKLLEQATSFAQIGKFHSYTTAHIWDEANGIQEVEAKTWRNHQGFKFLNLHAQVDIQEFNTSLERGYERRVQVKAPPWNRKEADGSYTRVPSDWEAIFEPSLFTVAGVKDVTKALKAVEGKYVRVLDVKQQPTKRQPEPEYNTVKFDAIFNSREEAYAAYQALRGGSGETAPVVAKTYSDDVVSAVKTLAQVGQTAAQIATSIGGDLTETDVKSILES